MDDIAQAVSDVMRLRKENQTLMKESLNKTDQIERLNFKIEVLEKSETINELRTKIEMLKSMIYGMLNE